MALTQLPSVSVIILNYNGRRFLDPCLRAALALDYPAEQLEIILCDNGSHDGSAHHVATEYPSVRLLALDANYGFAEGNNRAAATARHDWLVFLNNDMRFEPSWLRDLFAPLESQPTLACLTSRILNWDGTAIDFIGGGVNIEGHGFQIDHGAASSARDTARRVIAPCGGAMAIRRQLFRDLDGFDADYFCFFEDTDLGWRLNLLGHDVWYTPDATVYHRQHATARRMPKHQLRVLYERNALFTIYKCFDDRNLALALPTSLLLMNERALRLARTDLGRFVITDGVTSTGSEPAAVLTPPGGSGVGAERKRRATARKVLQSDGWLALGRKSAQFARDGFTAFLRRPLLHEGYFVPNIAVSHHVAMHEFACSLGIMGQKRRRLQAERVRSDQELLPLLAEPLRPSWEDPLYRRFHAWLMDVGGLTERFGSRLATTDHANASAPPQADRH